MSVLVGEGVAAVATNKILAVTSASTALIVYWVHGHVRLKRSLIFVLSVGVASVAAKDRGSTAAVSTPLLIGIGFFAGFTTGRSNANVRGTRKFQTS